MCFVSICYGYVLYFSSLSLLQARSSPTTSAQRERKGGQNRAPGDVDQKRFAFGDLRDDVLRRVGRFRGDDGGCNQRRGRDDGLLFVLVPKKKRGFVSLRPSIRFFFCVVYQRAFFLLFFVRPGRLFKEETRQEEDKSRRCTKFILPSGKRKNHSGRDGRARKSSATSRARERTRRDFLRLFSRSSSSSAFLRSPRLDDDDGKINRFRALKRRRKTKKTKKKKTTQKTNASIIIIIIRRKAKERTFSTVGFFNAFAGFALARFVCAEFVRVVSATTFAEEAATAYMIFFYLAFFFL